MAEVTPEQDLKLRTAAQAALVIGFVDMDEIGAIDLTPIPDSTDAVLRIAVIRRVTNGQALRVMGPAPMHPTETNVRERWSPAMCAEYRRQWEARPAASSLQPPLPIHPDQVDLWHAEAHS